MKSLFVFFSLSLASLAYASDANMTIKGFKFQTCKSTDCIEVVADQAWMSQLGFSFTTNGATTITLRHGDSVNTFDGTQATLHERLKIVVLDQADGSARMFSIEDMKELGVPQ